MFSDAEVTPTGKEKSKPGLGTCELISTKYKTQIKGPVV